LIGVLTGAIAATAAPKATAVETLVSGFNGDLSSTFGATWDVYEVGWSSELVPALSEGTGALRVYHNTNWQAGIKLPGGAALAQAIVNNDTLELDLIAPYGINWRQLAVIMNTNPSGNFHQTTQFDVSYPTEAAPFQHVVVNLADTNGKNWKALAQQWLDNPVPEGDPQWFELMFSFQGADQPYSADFNFDQGVDAADFLIWQQNYGHQEAGPDQGDANFDFIVDNLDLQQWTDQFGRRLADPYVTIDNIRFVKAAVTTSVGAVPEPGTFAIGLMGATFVVRFARRREQRS